MSLALGAIARLEPYRVRAVAPNPQLIPVRRPRQGKPTVSTNGMLASAARRGAGLFPRRQMHIFINGGNYGSIRDHNSSSRIGLHLASIYRRLIEEVHCSAQKVNGPTDLDQIASALVHRY
jgi:hypothetical protein